MLLIFLLAATLSSDPADLVRELYANAGAVGPDPVYSVTSRKALEQTFEGPIVDLIWRDLIDRQGEVGRMDAHWLFDAQDDDIENLKVETIENAGGRARVRATFDFASLEGGRTVEFQLRETAEGWRISNIGYAGGSTYMDILKADFPVPKIEDERSEDALCRMYANYDVPEDADAEMLANGDGVERDFGAAIHVLCRDEDNMADAERWGMLDHVLRMERGLTDEPLDFCEHATSRYGGIICASRHSDEERPKLRARYEAIRKSPALEALRKAADAFIEADAHWENETMRGGTIYSYIGVYTELAREEKFIDLLEAHSQERAPAASEADFKQADKELNAAYRKRLADIQPCDPEYESCEGPTESENLRSAQRVWIKYRDAWVAYYQDRWSGAASRDALRREIATRLTRERIKELSFE